MARKTLLAALTALACLPAGADELVSPPLRVSCIPPLLWRATQCECANGATPVFTSYGTALCPTPVLGVRAPACTITITYAAASPDAAVLVADSALACDEAGGDLAIAAALARRLGAP